MQSQGIPADYESLFRAVPDKVMIFDLDGHLLAYRETDKTVLGIPGEELLGRSPFDVLQSSSARQFKRAFGRIRDGSPSERFDFETSVDGQHRVFAIFVRPYENDRFVVFARDITERIRMSRELQEARREAEESSAMKSRFMANVSHEIRTPLNSILGYPNVILESIDEMPRSEIAANLRPILRSGQYLLRMLSDLIDISRSESRDWKIERRPISVADIVQQCAEILRPLSRSRSVNLQISDEASHLEMLADRDRIAQVVINLGSNAIKASRPDQTVQITFGASNRALLIQVKDNGPGIPPEYQKKVFEPLFQLGNYREKVNTGTGLGLTIAKRIIELHDGSLNLESDENGTHFHVALPGIQSDDRQSIPKTGLTARRKFLDWPRRVLIAEDDHFSRILLKRFLEHNDVETICVETGEQAVAHAFEDLDVVLTDMHLPGINGHEVATTLHWLHSLKGLTAPVIAGISGDEIDLEEFPSFDASIPKPFEFGKIFARLETAWDNAGDRALGSGI
ncbi:MAG: PAS domain-containing protein [Leptospiraceae bacterium]|nr:PAS domain-containing protein [Leptospiraceae bacterium]